MQFKEAPPATTANPAPAHVNENRSSTTKMHVCTTKLT